MKNILRAVAFLLFALIVCSLVGCTSSEYDSSLYVDIGDKLSTLDPQLVENAPDRTTVLTIFEGLMREDENGNPVLGAAESYEKNGLTYTFTLREGLCWNDGTPLTSADFVYALQRAAAKKTDAPDFKSIACIAGATAVHGGADVSGLGVKAVDERTLTITLSYDDGKFLNALTRPICMPCNEKFFLSTNGKYGRDDDSIISNGAYRLHTWNTYGDYLIRLRRNENYIGDFGGVASTIFITSDPSEERFERLKKNSIDLSFIGNTETEEALESGLAVDRHFNRCWFIMINKNGALGSKDIRRALSMAIHRNNLENELPSFAKRLDLAMPVDSLWNGKTLKDRVTGITPEYQPDEAYRIYSRAASELEGASPFSITYPADSNIESVASSIASGWQQTLGCFINMKSVDTSDDMLAAVESGNYTVALCPIEAISTDAYDFLSFFKTGNGFGFANPAYDNAVNSLHTAGDEAGYVSAVKNANSLLFADNSLIPVTTTPTQVAYSKNLSSVRYSLYNSCVDLSQIVKKD